MIKIIAKSKIKADCIDLYKTAVRELVEKSCAEEGNVYYTVNQNTADPTRFAFIECWKDQAAIDFHNNSEHFKRLVPMLGKFVEQGEGVEFFNEIEF